MRDPDKITMVEQRATVWYFAGDQTRRFEGWVMLDMDKRGVVFRRVRGRNRWRATDVDNVFDVRLLDEKGK